MIINLKCNANIFTAYIQHSVTIETLCGGQCSVANSLPEEEEGSYICSIVWHMVQNACFCNDMGSMGSGSDKLLGSVFP